MLKRTLTFKDLDENDVTEDFYFHLSKAELAEMAMTAEGGMDVKLQSIIASKDKRLIVDTFKEFIRDSVGKRSEDGRRFIKSKEITDEFMQSDAYGVLLMEIFTDELAASSFIKAIVPSEFAASIEKNESQETLELPASPVVGNKQEEQRPAWVLEDREPTNVELQNMTPSEMRAAFAARERRLKEQMQS